ncbi:hypothetical protein PPEP_a1401 [Pseudoalteromonas peptidolytica F12-50-A1]|uniref:Uncharacterized protein n=1 Tax=Pseudoalteromonas peptidolytica F12-50-A1 TaxID=1315280 RepID=A0A8I0MVM5_9GAMM|nr:hypothetical protein [Pseudoalteromonas peptidolytica F12-50-A1]
MSIKKDRCFARLRIDVGYMNTPIPILSFYAAQRVYWEYLAICL